MIAAARIVEGVELLITQASIVPVAGPAIAGAHVHAKAAVTLFNSAIDHPPLKRNRLPPSALWPEAEGLAQELGFDAERSALGPGGDIEHAVSRIRAGCGAVTAHIGTAIDEVDFG